MPYTTSFPGQEPGEKTIMILRRHPWIVIKIISVYAFLALLPILFRYILINYTDLAYSENLMAVLNLLLSLYYIFIITLFFRSWLDYYLDIWIITSERIINIEQKGLFSRQVSAQRLHRIQDVTAEVKGILPTFLHYGDVYIQTAASQPRFIFKKIANPYEVAKKLTLLVNWKKENVKKEEVESK